MHSGPGLANSYIASYIQPYIDFCNIVFYDQCLAGKTQLKSNYMPESLSLEIMLKNLKKIIENRYGISTPSTMKSLSSSCRENRFLENIPLAV